MYCICIIYACIIYNYTCSYAQLCMRHICTYYAYIMFHIDSFKFFFKDLSLIAINNTVSNPVFMSCISILISLYIY